jgi:hypothetical protein
MRRSVPSAIVAAVAVCSCATPSAQIPSPKLFAEATPLCAILDNPKSYIGKQVFVRGYLTQDPHGREFSDDGCKRGVLPVVLGPETAQGRQLRSKLGAYLEESHRRPPRVRVVYSGMFTDHSPALICDELCSQFTLEAAELVAVSRS